MGRRQQEAGRVKLACHLGANATKMHWHGTPRARRGTPVLNSREKSKHACERGTPGTGRGMLVQSSRNNYEN
ncbi:hypothetical protein AHAS_Ahas13G0257800 [Arachis hypogaea]